MDGSAASLDTIIFGIDADNCALLDVGKEVEGSDGITSLSASDCPVISDSFLHEIKSRAEMSRENVRVFIKGFISSFSN